MAAILQGKDQVAELTDMLESYLRQWEDALAAAAEPVPDELKTAVSKFFTGKNQNNPKAKDQAQPPSPRPPRGSPPTAGPKREK